VNRAATGQSATCWIITDGTRLYASNTGSGSGTLSGCRDNGSGNLRSAGTTATDPGNTDPALSGDGRYLYVQTGASGTVDEFLVSPDGSLTPIGSVTVPGAVGGEGIAAS
jgi:6-phosphogluconolactonase (cycloisomerase 2 family)